MPDHTVVTIEDRKPLIAPVRVPVRGSHTTTPITRHRGAQSTEPHPPAWTPRWPIPAPRAEAADFRLRMHKRTVSIGGRYG